jgi:hypothetical protein
VQLNEKQTKALYESGIWKNWTPLETFLFQMSQERLCIDFDRFQLAVEDVLGRPVFTHEFVEAQKFWDEFIKKYKYIPMRDK